MQPGSSRRECREKPENETDNASDAEDELSLLDVRSEAGGLFFAVFSSARAPRDAGQRRTGASALTAVLGAILVRI